METMISSSMESSCFALVVILLSCHSFYFRNSKTFSLENLLSRLFPIRYQSRVASLVFINAAAKEK